MTTITDPRSYVESRPISRDSHKGLRISARSVTVYTCNVPDRREVAKQNYLRRSHIMNSCGYNSVTYKPYQTVGKVYLDNKKMILGALGQNNDKEQLNQEKLNVQMTLDNKSLDQQQIEDDLKGTGDKTTKFSTAETQSQYLSSKSSEKLENIQSHLVKGRKMINAVRLGCNLFHLIKKEQKRLADEAERERQRRLEASRQSMQILSTSCSDDSDDEEDFIQLKTSVDHVSDEEKQQKPSAESQTETTANTITNRVGTSHSENLSLPASDYTTIRRSTSSSEKLSPRLRRKLRSSVRPYSAVYSNISYPELGTRESLFRQLCALNWILDAMSQDTFPPVVTPVTNCWSLRELRSELRASRKRVERERQTDSNWQSFLSNPSRFSQRESRKGIAHRISVHPQHLQRLSAVTSSSSTGGHAGKGNVAEQKTRRGSCASTNPETYATEVTTDGDCDTEVQYQQLNEEGKKTTASSPRTMKSPEKTREDMNTLKNSSVGKSFTTIVNAAYEEKRSRDRRLSQRHLNQLTSSEISEYPVKKTESRVNAWVRQTGQGNSKTKFVTAALAAFGTIAVGNYSDQVPTELRKRFDEVSEEKKIVLSDKLESQNKKQWGTLRRKFVGIDHTLHVHRALEKMRNDFSFVEPETREEMRQRVSEECRWYKDLIDTFPDDIKRDQYISFILNKIARYGSLEGRKTSVAHFLKIIATLRPWELCYPEIAAAIEFVRENIVGISTVEYDDWLSLQTSS